MYNLPLINFPVYSGWTQYTPVIPKFYWDVYSAEQRMKQLCMNFDKLEHYVQYMADTFNEWDLEFTKALEDEITAMWEAVHSGYEEAIREWFARDSFRELANQVFFGLTDDGHFVAYIPESWDDIIFDTGFNYGDDTYGRLILRWDVDNQYPATQTPYEANRFGRY